MMKANISLFLVISRPFEPLLNPSFRLSIRL